MSFKVWKKRNVMKSSLARITWMPILKRSAIVSAIVGTLLNCINQPEAIFGDAHINLAKALLTYLVPFFVATYAAYSALRSDT